VIWGRSCYFNLDVYGIALVSSAYNFFTAWRCLSENQAETCSCHIYDNTVICLINSCVWRSLPPNRDIPFSASPTRSSHLFIHADLWWVCSQLVKLWFIFCPKFGKALVLISLHFSLVHVLHTFSRGRRSFCLEITVKIIIYFLLFGELHFRLWTMTYSSI
jgi:hypothetical protein